MEYIYYKTRHDGKCLTECKYRPNRLIGTFSCDTKCEYLYASNAKEKFVICNFKEQKPMKPIFENEEEIIRFVENIVWPFMRIPKNYEDRNDVMINIVKKSNQDGYIKKSELDQAKEDYNELRDNEENTKFPISDNYISLLEKENVRLTNEKFYYERINNENNTTN